MTVSQHADVLQTITKDRRKKWPTAERHTPSNYPRNNNIAGRISAPFPFSFLKWQPFFIHGSICQATHYSPSRKAASEFSIDESCSKSCLPRHKEHQWTNISISIIICWLSINDKVWKPVPKMTMKTTLTKHSHQRKKYVYLRYIVFYSCY